MIAIVVNRYGIKERLDWNSRIEIYGNCLTIGWINAIEGIATFNKLFTIDRVFYPFYFQNKILFLN